MRLRFAVVTFVVVSCVVVALVSILPPTFQLINSSEDDTHDRFLSAVASLKSTVDNFFINTQTFPEKIGTIYTQGSLDYRNPTVMLPAFSTLLQSCGPQCSTIYFGLVDDYYLIRDTSSWCQPLADNFRGCCDLAREDFSCKLPPANDTRIYRPTQRPWYPPLAAGPTWSPLYVDFTSGGFAATVGGPLIARDGTFLGVQALDVSFVPLANLLASMKVVEAPSAWALYEAGSNNLLDSSVGLRSSSSLLTIAALNQTALGPVIADLTADELAYNGTLIKQSGQTLSRRYIAVEKVGNVTGVNLRIIVVFVEDPSGARKDSIILSSSLTAAAVVLGAALIATLAIFFFERPLNAITDEIEQAVARAMGLKNNDDDESIDNNEAFTMPTSHITELQDITDSFVELVEELKRIRAFVPKSCLVGKESAMENLELMIGADEDETPSHPTKADSERSSTRGSYYRAHDDSDGKHPPAVTPSASRRNSVYSSNVKQPSVSRGATTLTVPTSKPHRGGGAPQLYTGKSLHHATVTYLWIQLRNLTEALEAISDHKVGYDALGLIADCCDVVSSRFKGVIDVYNGDRVTIAFNGMKPNSVHRRSAAECAVVLSQLVRTLSVDLNGTLGLTLNKKALEWQRADGAKFVLDARHKPLFPLGVSSGIATSRALVGNVGSANLARFSIVGACVRAAAAEELKCSAAPPSIQCLCDVSYQGDISHSVVYQRVDVGTIAPMRLLVEDMTNQKTANDSGEWMYELQRAQEGNEFNEINDAFDAFTRGDITAAHEKLEAAAKRSDGAVTDVGRARLEALMGDVLSKKRDAGVEGGESASHHPGV